MSSSEPPPLVYDNELLARFIFFSGWFRKDQTVRPDGFMPYPHSDLSVTRHWELSESQLWQIGHKAAGDPTRHSMVEPI
jgi:hypothetical protein